MNELGSLTSIISHISHLTAEVYIHNNFYSVKLENLGYGNKVTKIY